MRNSIAKRLQKYTWSSTGRSQQENFLTELVGGVLNSSDILKIWFLNLLDAARSRGCNKNKALHDFLPNQQMSHTDEECDTEVSTQYTFQLPSMAEATGSSSRGHRTGDDQDVELRRPDIKVVHSCGEKTTRLYYIECKLNAGWGKGQPEKYHKGWKSEVSRIRNEDKTQSGPAGGVIAITLHKDQYSDNLIKFPGKQESNGGQYLTGGLTWQELAVSLIDLISKIEKSLNKSSKEELLEYAKAHSWARELLNYLKEEVGVVTDPIERGIPEIWTDTNTSLDILRRAADMAFEGRGLKAHLYSYQDDEGVCIGWKYQKRRRNRLIIYYWGTNDSKKSGLYIGACDEHGKYNESTDERINEFPGIDRHLSNLTETEKSEIAAEQVESLREAIGDVLEKSEKINIDKLAPKSPKT